MDSGNRAAIDEWIFFLSVVYPFVNMIVNGLDGIITIEIVLCKLFLTHAASRYARLQRVIQKTRFGLESVD